MSPDQQNKLELRALALRASAAWLRSNHAHNSFVDAQGGRLSQEDVAYCDRVVEGEVLRLERGAISCLIELADADGGSR